MSRREIGDLFLLIEHPVYALVFMAIFVHAGREDRASYALVASMLMGVFETAAFVAGKLVMRERIDRKFSFDNANYVEPCANASNLIQVFSRTKRIWALIPSL